MRFTVLTAVIVLLVAGTTSAKSTSWKTRDSKDCTTWEFNFEWHGSKKGDKEWHGSKNGDKEWD